MDILTLDRIAFDALTECFNRSFADYFVSFEATPSYLRGRWRAARVDYELSWGVRDDGELVGFMVHGVDHWKGALSAFNAGTGVIPAARGHRLVARMYEEGLPTLAARGIESLRLEVIQANERAIRAYAGVGFEIERELRCFRGEVDPGTLPSGPNGLRLVPMKHPDWAALAEFWDVMPAWEYGPEAVEIEADAYELLGAWQDDRLVGYVAHRARDGYIAQIAVAPQWRRKGVGSALLRACANKERKLRINNVDPASSALLAFLQRAGLDNHIDQYEMQMAL